MKKSALALAVLGTLAGAASAQSSVTLYGRVELNGTAEKSGDLVKTLPGETTYKMNDGGGTTGIGGSRWGMRGTEDLGGGLKANFVLESGYSADSGASGQNSRLFGRLAWVGISSASLGEVRLGRQETFSRLAAASWDPSFNGQTKLNEVQTVSPSTAADPTKIAPSSVQIFQNFGDRIDNVASYYSPVMGGFQVAAQVGAGEGGTVNFVAGTSAARYQGVMARFNSGPIGVAASYEAFDYGNSTGNKTASIGANYNFGFATAYVGFQQVSDVGSQSALSTTVTDSDSYTVGVKVPVGAFTVLANYSEGKFELKKAGNEEASLKKLAIGVNYALSKRTSLYSTYATRSGDLDDVVAVKTEFTLLGLSHTF